MKGSENLKLYDSELKVMEVLWKNGEQTAGSLAKILAEEIGWNRNTTYTVIKKCIAKGAIDRVEPNFLCRSLITKEEVQKFETKELIDKVFEGSAHQLFAALLGGDISNDEISEIKKMIQERE